MQQSPTVRRGPPTGGEKRKREVEREVAEFAFWKAAAQHGGERVLRVGCKRVVEVEARLEESGKATIKWPGSLAQFRLPRSRAKLTPRHRGPDHGCCGTATWTTSISRSLAYKLRYAAVLLAGLLQSLHSEYPTVRAILARLSQYPQRTLSPPPYSHKLPTFNNHARPPDNGSLAKSVYSLGFRPLGFSKWYN